MCSIISLFPFSVYMIYEEMYCRVWFSILKLRIVEGIPERNGEKLNGVHYDWLGRQSRGYALVRNWRGLLNENKKPSGRVQSIVAIFMVLLTVWVMMISRQLFCVIFMSLPYIKRLIVGLIFRSIRTATMLLSSIGELTTSFPRDNVNSCRYIY